MDEEAYIADVGFGGYLLAAPLNLKAGVEQSMPAGALRLVADDLFFTLQAWIGSAWQNVYRFTLEPHFPIDFEIIYWFTSAHPKSRFRQNLMVQRLTADGRASLLNRRLVRRKADGLAEEATLMSPADLERALVEDFNLELDLDPATVLARLPPA
jgi:N-hydroxyarylamine O-acetyltransferase